MISWEKVSWGYGLQVPWSVHLCRDWRLGWVQRELPLYCTGADLSAVVGSFAAEAVCFTEELFPAQWAHSSWPHSLHMTKRWHNSGHSSSFALGNIAKCKHVPLYILQHVFLTASVPALLALVQWQAFADKTPSRSLHKFLISLFCVHGLWKVRLQHQGTTVQLRKSSFFPFGKDRVKISRDICLSFGSAW